MDFGTILGEGLLGAGIGFTNARMDTIKNEEEEARLTGLANLKREWQIKDREWDVRMAEKKQAYIDKQTAAAEKVRLEERRADLELKARERREDLLLASKNQQLNFDREDKRNQSEAERKAEADKKKQVLTSRDKIVTAFNNHQKNNEYGENTLTQEEYAKKHLPEHYAIVNSWVAEQQAKVKEQMELVNLRIDKAASGPNWEKEVQAIASSIPGGDAYVKQYMMEKYPNGPGGKAKKPLDGLLMPAHGNPPGGPGAVSTDSQAPTGNFLESVGIGKGREDIEPDALSRVVGGIGKGLGEAFAPKDRFRR